MSMGLLFWIIMVIWLLGHAWLVNGDWRAISVNLVPWILFLLLGWQVFGAPIRG